MNFDIPEVLPPSAEHWRAWAESHLAVNRPFRVDVWPAAGPLVELALSNTERAALITW